MLKSWRALSVDLPSAKVAIGMPTFRRDRLLTLSLLDTSSLNETQLSIAEQIALKTEYRRLAYLGDALIDAALANYLFSTHANLTRENMDNLRKQMACRESLCQFAIELGWPSYCTSKNKKNRQSPEQEPATYGEMFEALAAAVFIEYDHHFEIFSDWLIERFLRDVIAQNMSLTQQQGT